MLIPTTIVDNFFECPSFVRDYALTLEYGKHGGHYPGTRTDEIFFLNPKLCEYLSNRIMSLFYTFNQKIDWKIDIRFQLTPEHYECGWAHADGAVALIAGVVYLNPDAPLNGGTLLCKPNKKFHDPLDPNLLNMKDAFYDDKIVDMNLCREARNHINDRFDVTLQVNNVYNRALIYNANEFHREHMFFGKDKESSRLTLVFFANQINTTDKTLLQKSKLNYNY